MEIARLTITRSVDDSSMDRSLQIEAVDPMGDSLDAVEILGMLTLGLLTYSSKLNDYDQS